MSEKKYFGSAKEYITQYGEMYKISFSRKDLEEMLENLNKKDWINLVMSRRRQPSEWGQTHSISLDTFEPKQRQESKGSTYEPPKSPPPAEPTATEEDLPF